MKIVKPERVSAIIERDEEDRLSVRPGSLRHDGKPLPMDGSDVGLTTSPETMGGMDMIYLDEPYHVEYFLRDEGPYEVWKGERSSYPTLVYYDGRGRMQTMPCCFLPDTWIHSAVGRGVISLTSLLYPIIAEREGREP